jgi:serine protease
VRSSVAPTITRSEAKNMDRRFFQRLAARALAAALLGLALLVAPATASERAPARVAGATGATATTAGTAGATRATGTEQVIVRWRAGVGAARERSAQAAGGAAAAPLRMARTLMQRHGIALADGASVDARTQVVRVAAGQVDALLARLAIDPEVEWAEVDQRQQLARVVPNDPLYGFGPDPSQPGQWFLRAPSAQTPAAIDAEAAWARTRGNPDIVVAVLDTGVRFDHPDLAGKLLLGYDFVSESAMANDDPVAVADSRDDDASDPGDYLLADELGTPAFPFASCGTKPQRSSWHGTQVAGLIAAATDNALGIAGAGWNLRVLPVRVLGKCGGWSSDIAAGIRWAAGLPVDGVPPNLHPARVINLSLGSQQPCSRVYADAIAAARAAGAVVVAAAGNQGVAVNQPANCFGVIAVAGVRHVGTKVGYSSLGPEVALAAPAGNCVNVDGGPCLYPLVTTSNTGTTVPASHSYTGTGADATIGTSFAAPLVAAAAGLMLSVQPGLTPDELAHRLRGGTRPFPTTADPHVPDCRVPVGFEAVPQLECRCTTDTCGAGLLDVGAAVARATAPLPAGGGGGGSLGFGWALGLALASLLLRLLDRRERGVRLNSPAG